TLQVTERSPAEPESGGVVARASGGRPSVVVAANRRDLALTQQRDGLLRKRLTVNDIACAHDQIAAHFLHVIQRTLQLRDIRVQVTDHGYLQSNSPICRRR